MAELKTSLLLKMSTYTCRGGLQATASCGHKTAKALWTYKIHKEGVPLRPIVSNTGAPTYKLS